MRSGWWFGVVVLAACGTTSSGGGGTVADVTESDAADTADAVDGADGGLSDATGDSSSACTTPAPTDKVCCDKTGQIGQFVCVAGQWQCPAGMTEKCDIVTDVVAETDAGSDVDAAGDTGGCDPAQKFAVFQCCCDTDMMKDPVCTNGQWTCPSGYTGYPGDQCTQACGPCSLPCFDAGPDAGGSDTTQDDTGGSDAGSAAEALCTSTGGSVYTGKCCSGAGDFPNECGIGGCTCPPQYLSDIHRCQCPSGQCFDPAKGCQ